MEPVERDLVGKRCRHCGEYKLYDKFHRHGRETKSGDGLSAHCVDCRRVKHKMQRYAISEDEVRELMTVTQCELCGDSLDFSTGSAHIDHCHTSGDVRGVLCVTCNLAIGGFRDSPELATAAAHYLLRNVDVLAMAGQITGREAI